MAHHQGMSLLSFAHVLLDRPIQRRFTSDPLVRTADLLLQERVPKQTVAVLPRAAEAAEAARPRAAEAAAVHRVITDPDTPLPEVHLLSNGNYHVMVTHAGGGYSRWRDLAVTRWREDCDLRQPRHLHLPARPRDGGLLVYHLPTDAQEARPVRDCLRAGPRRVPPTRPQDRDAHRGLRLARR